MTKLEAAALQKVYETLKSLSFKQWKKVSKQSTELLQLEEALRQNTSTQLMADTVALTVGFCETLAPEPVEKPAKKLRK